MAWLRQHIEAGQVRMVAHVTVEPPGYIVRLTEALPPRAVHESGHRYTSRELAFAAAEVLVRHRLGGHECGLSCSGWIEDPSMS